MRIQDGRTYYDHRIDITGLDLRGVTFDGCIVECWRMGPHWLPVRTEIRDVGFRHCKLIGDAWSREILEKCSR